MQAGGGPSWCKALPEERRCPAALVEALLELRAWAEGQMLQVRTEALECCSVLTKPENP